MGTRLDGAKLDMAWGIEADLTGASLKGATCSRLSFRAPSSIGADLSGARLVGSFEGGSLQGARLVGVNGAPDMRNQSMGMTRTSFRSARMQGADLTDAKLAWADLEFAKLQDAVLEGADLTRAWLGGANLTGAQLYRLQSDPGRSGLRRSCCGVSGRATVVGWEYVLNVDRAFLD